MKARFAETPEAVKNTLEVAEKCNLEIEFNKLHFPVFHPPEHFTREGYLRKLLADGLHKRYGIHAKAEGEKFVVEKIEDAPLLPTYPQQKEPKNIGGYDINDPVVAAAIKVVLDRLQLELK